MLLVFNLFAIGSKMLEKILLLGVLKCQRQKAADEIWKLSCDQTVYHEAFSVDCNFAV